MLAETATVEILTGTITAAVGAFFGAAAAVLINARQRSFEQTREFYGAVNRLILAMSQKRSLNIDLQASRINDHDEEDRLRVRSAIIQIRSLANDAVEKSPKFDSPLTSQLLEVIGACNAFVEQQEQRPTEYRLLVIQLSQQLRAVVVRLENAFPARAIARGYYPGERSLSLLEAPTPTQTN